MDVARLVLITAAALAVAVPAAHAQDDDAVAPQSAQARVAPKPWKSVRGIGRVLNLSKLPVVIDEPGRYALQQDWLLPGDLRADLIRVTAPGVTIDLHGFKITLGRASNPVTILAIDSDSVFVRNGTLHVSDEGTALRSTGDATRLAHLYVSSEQGIAFEGGRAWIANSRLGTAWGISLNDGSVIERTEVSCGRGDCLGLRGDGNLALDNRFLSSPNTDLVIAVDGNGNVIERNVTGSPLAGTVFAVVSGDRNLLRNNSLAVAPSGGAGPGIVFEVDVNAG